MLKYNEYMEKKNSNAEEPHWEISYVTYFGMMSNSSDDLYIIYNFIKKYES